MRQATGALLEQDVVLAAARSRDVPAAHLAGGVAQDPLAAEGTAPVAHGDLLVGAHAGDHPGTTVRTLLAPLDTSGRNCQTVRTVTASRNAARGAAWAVTAPRLGNRLAPRPSCLQTGAFRACGVARRYHQADTFGAS